MLQNFLIPQLENDMEPNALFQQAGAPLYFLQDIHNFLTTITLEDGSAVVAILHGLQGHWT
jgi:hypothetical protein